jgi:hypothetical protein
MQRHRQSARFFNDVPDLSIGLVDAVAFRCGGQIQGGLREGQIPSDEDMAELFRRRGVPTKAGLGAFGGLSVNGEWVYARLNGEIIAVSRHEAARRLVNAAPGEVAHAG